MFGFENHKGPDEHFQDIKRTVSAIRGKARRITVIMPLLYESRQHRRKGRESLDCALALQELERLGVDEVLTFDVHDPNVQNAIPLMSFENFYPTYDIVKSLIHNEKDLELDKEKLLVISPDTGAMDRAIYYSSVLGVDVGLFYKRRDHSRIVNGKNPIVKHEYMGRDVDGKDVLIVDDMIASGESVLDIAKELKGRNARNVYVATTFSFFTEGLEKFNKFFNDGISRELNFAIFDSTAPHEYFPSREDDEIIDVYTTYIDGDVDKIHKEEIKKIALNYKNQVAKGTAFLLKGEEVKNKLDDIYNNAFNHKEAKGVLEFLFE